MSVLRYAQRLWQQPVVRFDGSRDSNKLPPNNRIRSRDLRKRHRSILLLTLTSLTTPEQAQKPICVRLPLSPAFLTRRPGCAGPHLGVQRAEASDDAANYDTSKSNLARSGVLG